MDNNECAKIVKYNENNLPIKITYYKTNSAYKLHNPNGPALIYFYDNTSKPIVHIEIYYINNKKHNLNGPAYIEYDMDGNIIKEQYFINDKKADPLQIEIIKNEVCTNSKK